MWNIVNIFTFRQEKRRTWKFLSSKFVKKSKVLTLSSISFEIILMFFRRPWDLSEISRACPPVVCWKNNWTKVYTYLYKAFKCQHIHWMKINRMVRVATYQDRMKVMEMFESYIIQHKEGTTRHLVRCNGQFVLKWAACLCGVNHWFYARIEFECTFHGSTQFDVLQERFSELTRETFKQKLFTLKDEREKWRNNLEGFPIPLISKSSVYHWIVIQALHLVKLIKDTNKYNKVTTLADVHHASVRRSSYTNLIQWIPLTMEFFQSSSSKFFLNNSVKSVRSL